MACMLVLLGGPGAGKGTQSDMLRDKLGLPKISTGDLFRDHVRRQTELGKLAEPIMKAGGLVPDEITIAMVRERLQEPDCAQGAIFDGFPRTVAQAEALDALLVEIGQPLSVVPYIEVDPNMLLTRLSGRYTCRAAGHVYHVLFNPPQVPGRCDIDGSELFQRIDDTPETQRRRIEVYFEQTAPVIEYYRQHGLLAGIDGGQSIEKVFADLLEVIQRAGAGELDAPRGSA